MSEIEVVGGLLDGYTQIPNDMFRTPGIKSRAVHVYGNLRSHRSGWKTNINSVAKSTGLNKRTVMEAINDLMDLGYVTRQTVPGERGKFASYKYRVHDRPVQKATQEPGAESAPGNPVQKVHQEPGAESAPLKKTTSKKTNEEDHSPLIPQGGAQNKPASDRGHSLPEGWRPDPAVWDDMRAKFPNVDHDLEIEKFTDYWISQPGARGRKKDWNATWRNWVRNARPSQFGNQSRGKSKNTVEAWMGLPDGALSDRSFNDIVFGSDIIDGDVIEQRGIGQ